MIDLRRRAGGLDRGRLAGESDDGSATGGAPVGVGLGGNDGVAMAAGAFHLSTILYSGQDGTQRERAWGGRGSDAGRGWACDQPSLRDENSTIILGRKPAPDPGVTRCALSRWAELRALNRSFKLEFASWNLQVGAECQRWTAKPAIAQRVYS